jgi:Immunity protein 53
LKAIKTQHTQRLPPVGFANDCVDVGFRLAQPNLQIFTQEFLSKFMNELEELQQWYASNCNGDWEHGYGIEIDTLDNPGWHLRIELNETNLENHSFTSIQIENNEHDWYTCKVEKNKFEAFGDPYKLTELIKIFLDWAKSQKSDWLIPPLELTEEELKLNEDREFYNLLKDSPLTFEHCKKDRCNNMRLEHSMMCPDHHFEMLRNYPYPEYIESH